MNKERAKQEIIATRKTYADKKQKLEEKNEFEKSELKRRENKSFIHLYDNKINALDIAIDSLEREEIKDLEDLYLGLDIAIKILEKQREKVEPYERKE